MFRMRFAKKILFTKAVGAHFHFKSGGLLILLTALNKGILNLKSRIFDLIEVFLGLLISLEFVCYKPGYTIIGEI